MTRTHTTAVALILIPALAGLAGGQVTRPAVIRSAEVQATRPSLSTRPASPDQLAQQAAHAMAANDPDTAIKAYKALIQAQPNNTSALLGLAEAYIAANNGVAAVETYERCVKISPNDWRANFGLGTVYLQLEYLPLAKPYLEKALQLAPAQPQSRAWVTYNLAICYRGLHRIPEATDLARRVLALDSTNTDARRMLVSLYAEAGRFEDAMAEARATLDAVRAALAKTPDDRTLLEHQAQVLTMQSELLQAQITVQPDDPSPRLQMADVLEQLALANKQRGYRNAIDQLDAALKKAPNNADVLFARGRLEYLIGDPVKAAQDLRAALKIAPDNDRAKQLLEQIETQAGRSADERAPGTS
jgi:tetratricopeptide (TPR) repeat protein